MIGELADVIIGVVRLALATEDPEEPIELLGHPTVAERMPLADSCYEETRGRALWAFN